MLVLLPLQVVAAGIVPSCMGTMQDQRMDMSVHDGCDPKMTDMQRTDMQHAAQGEDGKSGQGVQQNSPCGSGAHCWVMSGAAVAPSAHHFFLGQATVNLVSILSSDFTSFVPEGLQRPPSIPV
jgi:hypothetical protein